MFDFLTNNLGTIWFVLGVGLLIVETYLFGMSTAVLLFAGISAVLTGILLWMGVVPVTWAASLAVFTVGTALVTALLWAPFKKMQSKAYQEPDNTSDLIGYEFNVDSDITSSSPGKVRYSGIEWRVELDTADGAHTINAGDKVAVSGVSAGVFKVVPANL